MIGSFEARIKQTKLQETFKKLQTLRANEKFSRDMIKNYVFGAEIFEVLRCL